MKKVIVKWENPTNIVILADIKEGVPIFARDKKNGALKGLVIKEDRGWITRTGGTTGCSGYHTSRDACIQYDLEFYDFFIED